MSVQEGGMGPAFKVSDMAKDGFKLFENIYHMLDFFEIKRWNAKMALFVKLGHLKGLGLRSLERST